MYMNKTVISTICLVAAFVLASSCSKINPGDNTGTGEILGRTVISGVAESIGKETKAELSYGYDVLWNTGDQIYVTTGTKDDTFTLSAGEKTTRGQFTEDGTKGIAGDIEAFYPSTLKTDEGYVWPAIQTNDQVAPMYAKQTISGTGSETVSFSSLGTVLQIVFNTTVPNIVLRSVEIKDGTKPLSGKFTVDSDGKAVISTTDAATITLDLGENGKILGKGANYFYMAVPAGKYEDLTLTFTGIDNGRFVMTGGKLELQRNTVGRLTLTGSKYHPVVLPGLFSVSAEKKVRFSPGNLRYDVENDIWSFFLNQYECGPATYSEGHDKEISLFTWGYGNWSMVPDTDEYLSGVVGGDDFSPAQDWGSRLGGGTVWRTLTKEEAQYLFDNSKRGRAVVCGINGHVIVPDSFVDPQTNRGSSAFVPVDQSAYEDTFEDNIYPTESDWDAMEVAGAVFFPAAGYREGNTIKFYNEMCDLWTTTSNNYSNVTRAYRVHMNESRSVLALIENKGYGFSVRLVTDVTE